MLLAGSWLGFAFSLVILILGVILIFIVLIQRGRGGGLIGALGGQGGSSPFGSRAGDLFTRVTIVLALVWIGLNMFQAILVQPDKEQPVQVGGQQPVAPPLGPDN
jgi:preprotein translocase subunit SecG